MKLLITGHTSNVGSILAEHLVEYEIFGVSRQTGFDLTKPEDIKRVIELSIEYDHFINLANVNHAQSHLLYGVYNLWKENSKRGKIISFGSLITSASSHLINKLPVEYNMLDYVGQKLILEKIHNELCFEKPFGSQPESILIRFANYGEKTGPRANEPYTTREQMIEVVDFALRSNTYVSTIDFREI